MFEESQISKISPINATAFDYGKKSVKFFELKSQDNWTEQQLGKPPINAPALKLAEGGLEPQNQLS